MIYRSLLSDRSLPLGRYEQQDVGVKAVVACLFGLSVLVFSALALVREGLLPDSPRHFERSSRLDLSSLSVISPPEPRLTARPIVERSEWSQREAMELEGGSTIPGKSQLPIREAMQHLVQQGTVLRTIPLQPKEVPASPEAQLRPTAGDAP